jgi:two-component system, cell cycle sensor histidine kinase and response regulator CckA
MDRLKARRSSSPELRLAIHEVDPSEEQGGQQDEQIETIAQMAATMTQDFNNALCAIFLYAELVQSRLPPDEPVHQWVEEIKKTGRLATSLTGKLRDFCREEVLQPETLDLSSVVIDNGKMLRSLLGPNIELEFRLAAALAPVTADLREVGQVILNLALYARDAMPKGGRIKIETSHVELGAHEHVRKGTSPGSYVLLTVSHNSCGMSDDVPRHLGAAFFTHKRRDERTGLALAKVCGLVQQSGGHINMNSEPGGGSTFRVYYPDAAVMEPAPESFPPEIPSDRPTVLLAEDNVDIRILVREVLCTLGYTVLEAGCGPEALRLAQDNRGRIHLLVTDIVMRGGLSGIELAKRLMELHPSVKLLFLSGYPGIMNGPLALVSEENFLPKPFSVEALAGKVQEVLERDMSGGLFDPAAVPATLASTCSIYLTKDGA